jgi:hypothetical protein
VAKNQATHAPSAQNAPGDQQANDPAILVSAFVLVAVVLAFVIFLVMGATLAKKMR